MIPPLLFAIPACAQTDASDTSDPAAARLAGGEAWQTDFSRHAVPLDEIVSGGPPKDGIPAIDNPEFVSAAAADEWLDGREPVIVVAHEGVARAYPLQILIWHEIVNDEVGDLPVAVTFCPLCNTALTFDRRLNGRVLDFGTTGRLRHSDLVMYDRQTETWWQQATGEAIVGNLVGEELRFIPANTLAWEDARRLYPDLEVLSRDTGHRRPYGQNPYAGYDNPAGQPMGAFFRSDSDGRLPAMERIVAVDLGDGWAAPFSALQETPVANAEVEGVPLVAFWKSGAASALDRGDIAQGRDVGQTAVFDRRIEDQTLTFEADGEGFRDRETGSHWNLAGEATAGPLSGRELQPIPHGNHFWFAWAVFKPQTEIWQP